MGFDENGGVKDSHEENVERQLHVLYSRQLQEKQIFMQELKAYRRKKDISMLHSLKTSIGPKWYQALSVKQRMALDNLESSIYKDLLEGRPSRTEKIMRTLGLFPRPSRELLMVCIERGRDDPKEMIAQLYYLTFGYPIEGKRMSYSLNARLMLSGIFYLGLNNLIYLLRERFRPDQPENERPQKQKPKAEPPLASPYLQKMVAVLYEKPSPKRLPPPPLPNLEELDDPYEEEPVIPKPPPPPPPPPPPKKRIPVSACDAMAGIYPLNLEPSIPVQPDNLPYRKSLKPGLRKSRSSKGSIEPTKKVYGLNLGFRKKTVRRRKPVAPSTGLENAQYHICGVYEINGKASYILGNVSILPTQGDFIHGGYTYVGNMCIPIHCGYRGRPPAPKLPPCDCQKTWQEAVLKYVKDTKCYCGHHFDYQNEGTFPADELPYFVKPTRHSGMRFNYQTIMDLDEKQLHVEKQFKRIWETDSFIHVDDSTTAVVKDDDKKKKKKKSSNTCLGANPKPEDYLKCAIRFMRRMNVAARLPDLHLVPELKEWMRKRLYGPLSQEDKAELLRKSTTYWRYFSTLAVKGYGHVAPPKDPEHEGHTTWLYKKKLNDNFRRYTHKYRLSVYRSHAYVTNLLWRSMYQAEQPDKKFREIFFSYLFNKLDDLQLINPYNSRETRERHVMISKRRYICLPEGLDAMAS